MKEYTRRNTLRLQGYDYSRAGTYFITICAKNSEAMFGKIVENKMKLSEYGKIAEQELQKTAEIQNLDLSQFVIMPNHVHFIVTITKPQPVGADAKSARTSSSKSAQVSSPKSSAKSISISSFVRSYKAALSRKLGFSLWQRSFYDRVIQCEEEHKIIARYIINNPSTWAKDKFYCL